MPTPETELPEPIALRPAGPVVPAAEAAVWTEAKQALDEARRWAEAKKRRARAAYAAEKKRGYRDGVQEGAEAAATLMAETAAAVDRHVAGLEGALPTLVLEIVEDILGAFDAGELLALAIRKALSAVRDGARVTLSVAPAMADDLRARLADLLDGEGAGPVELEADPGLDDAACVMRSALGIVELDIETQLRALRQGLAAADRGEG